MTNTLHRFGDANSFRDDYVMFAIASLGKDEQDSAALNTRAQTICRRRSGP